MFNLINFNSKSLTGIIVAALAGLVLYWGYTKIKASNAQAQANANQQAYDANTYAPDSGDLSQLASTATNLALLQSLFGGTDSTAETSAQAPSSTTQVTQSAPLSLPGAAPATSGSSVGNTTVNQV